MKTLLTTLVLASVLVLPASAQSKIGIGLRAGTMGPGVDVSYNVKPKLAVRLGLSYLPVTVTRDEFLEEEDLTLRFTGDATVGAIRLGADFHPFNNVIRLTGGLFYRLFEVSAIGAALDPLCLGDKINGVCDGKQFTAEKVGSFAATVSYEQVITPYLGIGLGRISGRKSRVGLLFDIGVMYAGSPTIDLEGSGLLAPSASEEQEATLNAGIESFKWWPRVGFGFAVRI